MQAHRPGEAAQMDFTSTMELGVTLAGQLFAHLLCVTLLPYSNWQWATPTHRISRDAADRTLNEEYKAVMRHLGMEPLTTAVGAKEQNGDVEASHGALKQRLEQALLVRGNRDFAEYERFITGVTRKANAGRGEWPRTSRRCAPLVVGWLPECTELVVPVAGTSPIHTLREQRGEGTLGPHSRSRDRIRRCSTSALIPAGRTAQIASCAHRNGTDRNISSLYTHDFQVDLGRA